MKLTIRRWRRRRARRETLPEGKPPSTDPTFNPDDGWSTMFGPGTPTNYVRSYDEHRPRK